MTFNKKFSILTCLFVLACLSLPVSRLHAEHAELGYWDVVGPAGVDNQLQGYCSQVPQEQTWTVSDNSNRYLTSAYFGDFGSPQNTMEWNGDPQFNITVTGGSNVVNWSSYIYGPVAFLAPQTCPCNKRCTGEIDMGYDTLREQVWGRSWGDTANYSAAMSTLVEPKSPDYSYGASAYYSVDYMQCDAGEINTGGKCASLTGSLVTDEITYPSSPASPVISWNSNSNYVQIRRVGTTNDTWVETPASAGYFTDSDSLPSGTYTYYLDLDDGFGTLYQGIASTTINVASPAISAQWNDTNSSTETITGTTGIHQLNLNFWDSGASGSVVNVTGCTSQLVGGTGVTVTVPVNCQPITLQAPPNN